MTNIILLSDGTGNSAGKVWRTNVWRLFQSLDLKGSDQIAIYDDGVGTSSFKPLAILGGVFGWGLKRNVLNLYKFLCRNYKPGDDIYAFGFSRGAFTIRVVIGLVLNQGLVNYSDEADLDRKARAAYRAYRHNKYARFNLQYPFRLAQYLFDKTFYTPCERPIGSIKFLGLWDTVAAYGLPIDEMTRGVSQWLWPLELPNHDYDESKITRARHALAMDDERATFHPVLWNETKTNTRPRRDSRPTSDEPLLQVWFSGVHSNVGGGYPDDSLANVSLAWMMAEAKAFGLVFKDLPNAEPDALLSTDSAKDKDGRLYDSRSGLGGYYRYSPRKIRDFYDAMPASVEAEREIAQIRKGSPDEAEHKIDSVWKPTPKIHESVFGRTRNGAHLYAPIGLPSDYEVVTSSDVKLYLSPPPVFETITVRIEPNDELRAEGSANAVARHDAQENVWDIVWRKRAIYFLTVFVTAYLLIYPLYSDNYAFQEMRTPLRSVSDAIRLIGAALPSLAQRWLDAYARDPAWFLVWAGLVAFLTWISSKLAGTINDRMRLIWIRYLPGSNSPTKTAPPVLQSPWKRAFSIFAIFYLFLYPLLNSVSWLSWILLPPTLHKAVLAYTEAPVRYALGAFLFFYFLPRPWVRWLRKRPLYQSMIRGFKNVLAPFVSAVGLLYLAVAFGSHYHYNFRDSFGSFCVPNSALRAGADGFNSSKHAEIIFDSSPDATGNRPNNLCVSTGVFLQTGQKYLASVQRVPTTAVTPLEGYPTFFDRTTFMGGQPISELSAVQQLTMTMLFPFRHTFDRPWGSFILRIGSRGNEEDFLDREPPNQIDNPFANDTAPMVINPSQKFSEVLTAKRDGELFIYLNKPMLGLWGFESLISNWIGDTGQAKVTIDRR